MSFTAIWGQALAESLPGPLGTGKNKTAVFDVLCPVDGTSIRFRFTNRIGKKPYKFGAVSVKAGDKVVPLTVDGKNSFKVPVGETLYTDAAEISVKSGEKIEIRLYFKNSIADSNCIEPDAYFLKGDVTAEYTLPVVKKNKIIEFAGVYKSIPSLDRIEVETEMPCNTIVAFGDSITSMSRWTKPLNQRLCEELGGNYQLVNSGILGNCLLYSVDNMFKGYFGEKGVVRYDRDVVDYPNLHTVIFALGSNDTSYFDDTTKDVINEDAFKKFVTGMTESLHAKGVRVACQTISPRKGYFATVDTPEKEELRVSLNEWIRTCGIFGYVFDANEVVRDPKDHSQYMKGLHQYDHLHPSHKGGKLLADSYDLKKLTGEK